MRSRSTPGATPFVASENGRKVLRVGGVIQSVEVNDLYEPDVWDAMVPDERPDRALILGLGGGTLATLLARRWESVEIVAVEFDQNVAGMALDDFGLRAMPNVRVVIDDAFTYVRTCDIKFDVVNVDLYVSGKMAHGILAASFLTDIARLLAPSGTASFNLWQSAYLDDQIRRIARNLNVRVSTVVDQNVVVWCSAKQQDGAI